MRALLFLFLTLAFVHIHCQRASKYLGQNPPGEVPQVFAPDLVSVKSRIEYGISFSPNGKEMAFGVLDIKDESGRIYYSSWTSNKWTEPAVASFLGNSSVYLPVFTPDGKSLLYTQSQYDSANYITDIWMVNKRNNGWDKPFQLPEPINSSTREGSVCITSNQTFYFSSGRDCIGKTNCPASIYSSRLIGGKYQTVEKETHLNIKGDNESIFVSADETFAIISNVTKSTPNANLYISFRTSNNQWSTLVKMDSTINTNDWELRPFVTADNKYLFFTRMSFDANVLKESDIYWVSMEGLLKSNGRAK
ncbi:MAG TPA: hypothetical protein VHO72_17970 [Bacteroidales bacterium]|nr:hypothetical protein [Bacteroidales bacterium]